MNLNGLLVVTVPDIEANLHSSSTIFHYAHIYNYNHLNLKKIFDKVGFQILNPETPGTRIYAKKISDPNNSAIKFNFEKNYQKIIDILKKSNLRSHYSSKKPYVRFLSKCYRYPKEILLAFLSKNHRSILDRTYSKYQNL